MSEPNKLLIHASFVAQAPSVWDYQWVSAGVLTTDNSKSSLQGALSEWCANAMEAEEVHGHVSTWDVTAVTDMSSLLAGSCRFTFNEDVNAWDVGQVTNMNVRRRALRQGHKAPARTQLLRERPQAVCACAGAAQTMFYYASAFNQPLAAWDVGQVINMNVRRRPASGSQGFTHSCACGAATSHVRVLVRRRICSIPRALSTSLWTLGTLARSPTCRCATALRQGHRAPTHTRRSGGHKPCACAGAAQSMFSRASAFNQPVEAWDVGQVTNMQVCRRPASGSQGSGANTAAQ